MDRTPTQAEANELDMEMHRLASRLERFADEHASSQDKGGVDRLGHYLSVNRYTVRRYMHPADVEATR